MTSPAVSPHSSPVSSHRSPDEPLAQPLDSDSEQSDKSDISFKTTSSFDLLATVHPVESGSQPTSIEAICDHQLDYYPEGVDDVRSVNENYGEDRDHDGDIVEAINVDLRNDHPVLLINDQPLSTPDETRRNNKVSTDASVS